MDLLWTQRTERVDLVQDLTNVLLREDQKIFGLLHEFFESDERTVVLRCYFMVLPDERQMGQVQNSSYGQTNRRQFYGIPKLKTRIRINDGGLQTPYTERIIII
ncbi:hypothetical protein CSKR_107254 [Clonorchis sinensis]|uniref:Uncharacterized protein n=1 Tax=Clonorchis sinensis TaxID=79923 RepID=A0A419PRA5_CLOSI|nr:hypothetical protein CSKR_107254 [Clonorchis sinensis]